MHPNLVDHLAALIAVTKAASFSAAAKQLNCAVSSVSYSIARLEEYCGFALFVRGDGPVRLTPQGQALLREAEAVHEGARRFRSHARSLERGDEFRLCLGVDILFPTTLLMAAVERFVGRTPHVRLQFFVNSLNSAIDDLRSGSIDFCLAPLHNPPADIDRRYLTNCELILVVGRGHPLVQQNALSLPELRRWRQLYYVGSPSLDLERAERAISADVWTANDIWVLRGMLMNGMGWCFATRELLHEELADGQIIELHCADLRGQMTWSFGALWHIDRPPGPLGRELLKLIDEKTVKPPMESDHTPP
jgi:DNA-binding transcriptional LysR family regulator